MFKLVVTMKRKKGTTMEEFEKYYNDRHVPYMKSLIPPMSGTTRTHRRNLVRLDDPFLNEFLDGRGVTSDPDFDCLTEVEFEDRESAITYFRRFFADDLYPKIKEDEENLVDLASVRFHVVEVIQTVRTV